MIDHKDSTGAVCQGCPDTCAQKDRTIVVGGVAITGCCAMLFPHGTFEFDADGNATREPFCCAGKEHDEELPSGCDAHAPSESKGHVVTVSAPFEGGRFPEQKAASLAAKLRRLSARDANGVPTGDRVADAGLTFSTAEVLDDAPVPAIKTRILDGPVVARVTALKKRFITMTGDEWHHVAPSDAEVAAVRAALGVN